MCEVNMELWTVYDYLVNTVNVYMLKTGHCLYNALVLTQADMTKEQLLKVRNSAYELIEFINQEITAKDAEERDDDNEVQNL